MLIPKTSVTDIAIVGLQIPIFKSGGKQFVAD
jgi:hypothetical protein